jgi:hypothetical protein
VKRTLTYLLIAVLAGAIILLFVVGKSKAARAFDDRITLKRQDKRPYATYVAYQQLPYIFPQAKIRVTRNEPGGWDSVSNFDNRQAYICITDRFGADEAELNRLMEFARTGNDVFISARYISSSMDDLLRCGSNSSEYSGMLGEDVQEVRFSLSTPPFTDTVHYAYPGKSFYSYFTQVDNTRSQILGTDENGHPNFIRLQTGMGFFYIHLEPLAFSNYFLLHEQNIGYYEKVLSLIRPDVRSIIWDEYYINKKPSYDQSGKQKGWMSVLMNMQNAEGEKPFRAAFWLLICLGILYVLLEMRRRQRIIPVIRKPSNDSLDFVKTIGRLYYDRSDHRNLCRKMSAYFLEFVRSNYKLTTGNLNEDFIRLLHYKSGVAENEIRGIVSFIQQLDQGANVNERQLAAFHKQLESFYQKA